MGHGVHQRPFLLHPWTCSAHPKPLSDEHCWPCPNLGRTPARPPQALPAASSPPAAVSEGCSCLGFGAKPASLHAHAGRQILGDSLWGRGMVLPQRVKEHYNPYSRNIPWITLRILVYCMFLKNGVSSFLVSGLGTGPVLTLLGRRRGRPPTQPLLFAASKLDTQAFLPELF